jgi:hypothetical protein
LSPDIQNDPLVNIPVGNNDELEAPLRDYLLNIPHVPDGEAWDITAGSSWLETRMVSLRFG